MGVSPSTRLPTCSFIFHLILLHAKSTKINKKVRRKVGWEGNSPERQDTESCPIGKRLLSMNPQHASVLTSEQLQRDNLAPAFLLLYMLSLIPLLSLKVPKSEILWKHPNCSQHFSVFFGICHFV